MKRNKIKFPDLTILHNKIKECNDIESMIVDLKNKLKIAHKELFDLKDSKLIEYKKAGITYETCNCPDEFIEYFGNDSSDRCVYCMKSHPRL